ncbi:MAG: hypothetical protein WBW75_02470, partial [Mycobacterium sp.]|uniref:hypothetical protein n=1 Tax=Mycobacterium sp. TaxID=1785 RepID=UPI003C5A90DF
MGRAVDVNPHGDSFHDRDHAVHPVANDHPPLVSVSVGHRDIRGADAGCDTVGFAAGAVNVQIVLLAPVTEAGPVTHLG